MGIAVVSRAREVLEQATRRLIPRLATAESAAPFGSLLGPEVANPGLGIPYYRASVVEGAPLPFACDDEVIVRAARILPRAGAVVWLERHLHVTQTFIGLGGAPFVLVLAPPADEPDLDRVEALFFPPGHGLMLERGTWHEFPLALAEPATVLTINSREIVDTLAGVGEARELDTGDVRKIKIHDRLGVRLEVTLVAPASP